MEDTDVCPKCGVISRSSDEDVLIPGSLLSCGLFTQGWPDHPEQLEGHHPTQVLVNTRDIIALLLLQRIMSLLYFTKEIPPNDVYIYANHFG